MINNQTRENLQQSRRATLLKTLEHRLEVAKAEGNTTLIAQLEAEKRYYLQ